MVNWQLVQYIKDNLKRGYNYQQIKNFLLQSNWQPYEIDEAINYVYTKSVDKESQESQTQIFKPKFLILTLIFITILISSFFFIFSYLSDSSSNPTQQTKSINQITHTIELSNTRLKTNEDIEITNSFIGENLIPGYVVFPTYKIYKSNDNNPILMWKSDRGILVTEKEKITKELTTSLSPGSYYIESTCNFKGETITSKTDFIIYEESNTPTCTDGIKNQDEKEIDCGGPCDSCPSCSDGIKNQDEEEIDCGGPCTPCEESCPTPCNDYNPCTENKCVKGACFFETIMPCCGNFICEKTEDAQNCPADCEEEIEKPVELMNENEIIDKARKLVKSSQTEAGNFCKTIKNANYLDKCFRIISFDSKNSNFCNYIENINSKDACFMDFAMEGDTSVCDKVNNPYLAKSCNALKLLNENK
jgi:hypothetical protein